jgi:hypothetical protein
LNCLLFSDDNPFAQNEVVSATVEKENGESSERIKEEDDALWDSLQVVGKKRKDSSDAKKSKKVKADSSAKTEGW